MKPEQLIQYCIQQQIDRLEQELKQRHNSDVRLAILYTLEALRELRAHCDTMKTTAGQ